VRNSLPFTLLCVFSRLARYVREGKGIGKEKIETWNGSPGMVQGYPQSTLLAVAASRAKDKGGPTLSSVPTLRYLLYMPFRDTIRSACGSNGSHVSRVHVYPSHNETLPPPSLLPRLFFLSLRWNPFPSAVMHFGPEFQSKGLSKRQRAARILG